MAEDKRKSWTWDKAVGMGYLSINPNAEVHASRVFSGDGHDRIIVDYDTAGNIIGIEVFG